MFLTHKKIKLSLILLSSLLMLVNSPVCFDATNIPPPGKLIEVNNGNMHIHCLGNKNLNDKDPTIILDSGTGGFSIEWINIQRTISKHAKICAYDRRGYGWSDMGDLPRTTKKIVYELHNLLQNAKILGPYIMVGHSFGGFTAQYFTRQFSDQVVGMVLIDSSHEEQVYRLPEDLGNSPRNAIDQKRNNIIAQAVIHENFPEEYVAYAHTLMNQRQSLMTWREEMANYVISSRQLRDINHKSINDIPLHILSRGKRVWPNSQYGNNMEKTWAYLQNDFNTLSSNSTHIISQESGHSIHLDQPELVIQSILSILQSLPNDVQKEESAILKIGAFSQQQAGDSLPDSWQPLTFKKIPAHTHYGLVEHDGITVLQAKSDNASSGLIRHIEIDPAKYPIISWRWKINNIPLNSDVTRKEGDDYPARVYITFAYDKDKIRWLDKIKYKAAKLFYGEYPPLAAISYIWSNNAKIGSIIDNPYTDRVRMVILENKSGKIGEWVSESRNIYEDYKAAFGETLGENPPLISAVAVMTDTDNTHQSAIAWYGDITFQNADQ